MTEEKQGSEEEEKNRPALVSPITDRQRTGQTFAGLLLIVGGWSGFFLIPPGEGADPIAHRFFAGALLVLGGVFVNKKATEEWLAGLLLRFFKR